MSSRQILFVVMFGVLFLVNMAGASWLALTGSDRAPFEQRFSGQCADPTISLNLDKTGNKVVEVILTGDFSDCLGSQLLVTTYKTGNVHSYAVKDVTSLTPTISLHFKVHDEQGDFRQKFPLVIENRLVPQGPLAPPTGSLDPSEMQVVFAWTWQ